MKPIHYIIILVCFLALYLLVNHFINKNRTKLIYDEIEVFCIKNNLNFKMIKNQRYDIKITSTEFDMFIKVLKVVPNSSITINNRATWCLRYGGGHRKGRTYPQKRYLNELIPFLNSNITSSEKKTIRVVLVYPQTEVILKYVNESDLTEIYPKDLVYGFKVIKFKDLETKFSDLLK